MTRTLLSGGARRRHLAGVAALVAALGCTGAPDAGDGAHGDAGGAAGAARPAAPPAAVAAAAELPAADSSTPPPPPPPAGVVLPAGMVYVPGGEVHVGSRAGAADEQPVFVARVAPFALDRHPVTVAEFGRFVERTGYRTDAERFGDGAVMDAETGGWTLVPGATWRAPLGPEGPPAPADHPVTQVSWRDAAAYARSLGRRLPTEVEWEHAARGGADRQDLYSWGNRLVVHGRHQANTGQRAASADTTVMGDARPPATHQHPSDEDGYLLTSPVGTYPATRLGLTDMGGNVWEWTDSWYRPYADRARPFAPDSTSERVQRGGSFLCSTDYCHGFRVSARAHSTPETALFHVGFRTAASLPAPSR